MSDRFHVQWTPRSGPPQRVVFEPSEDDGDTDVGRGEGNTWSRIAERWDGSTWSRTHTEVVEDPSVYAPAPPNDTEIERAPPTLRELLEETQQTWEGTDPKALVFELPAGPFVITVPHLHPRCYSDQLPTTQPVAMKRLRALVRQVGMPRIEPLEQTPFSSEDFVRGEFDA